MSQIKKKRHSNIFLFVLEKRVIFHERCHFCYHVSFAKALWVMAVENKPTVTRGRRKDKLGDGGLDIYTLLYIKSWGRKWQPTPESLPGKAHEQRSLVGCSPWGRKESGMTEQLTLIRKIVIRTYSIAQGTLLYSTMTYAGKES